MDEGQLTPALREGNRAGQGWRSDRETREGWASTGFGRPGYGGHGSIVTRAMLLMLSAPREACLSGYYQRWLAGLESQHVRAEYLGPAEVDARIAGCASPTDARRISRMRLTATFRMMSFLLRQQFPHWFAAQALPRLMGTSRPTLRGPRFADPGVVDKIIDHYETNVGPLNGAKVVARAWTDQAHWQRLLTTRRARSQSSVLVVPRTS
jgi:hypothetical protein